jgi:hypothetical protein
VGGGPAPTAGRSQRRAGRTRLQGQLFTMGGGQWGSGDGRAQVSARLTDKEPAAAEEEARHSWNGAGPGQKVSGDLTRMARRPEPKGELSRLISG